MFKPYRQVEETEDFVVYEFKAVYLYIMYGILAIMAVAYFTSIQALLVSGGFIMILYCILVSTQYMKLGRITKRAAKAKSLEMSGSKWSFSKPLRIKVNKEFT